MKEQNDRSCFHGCLRIITGGIGLMVFLAIFLVGFYVVLRGAGAFLIVADPLEEAKAIIILSGGTESRMREALDLYDSGYGDVIILTETGEQLEDLDVLHSLDMRIQLMNNGVPGGNILVTSIKVSSTLDEALAVKQLMEKRQFSSGIVVTDPYHTKRSSIIFDDVFPVSKIEIYIRPVRNSWYSSASWFLNPQGWRYTILEYAKMIGYLLNRGENQEFF